MECSRDNLFGNLLGLLGVEQPLDLVNLVHKVIEGDDAILVLIERLVQLKPINTSNYRKPMHDCEAEGVRRPLRCQRTHDR